MLSILVQDWTFQQSLSRCQLVGLSHVLGAASQTLVALISQDADLTMEALSNLPEDARGRLQTLLTLSQDVADQAAHGHLVVVDTGLGEATYTLLESGEESATTEDADAEQPASQPVLAWADQLDTLDDFVPFSPGLPLTDVSQAAAPTLTDAGTAVDQPTQDQPTQDPPVSQAQGLQ